MMTLDEVRAALNDRNLSMVAESVGVTRSYLSAIRSGKAGNPSYEMVKRLSEYLEGKQCS